MVLQRDIVPQGTELDWRITDEIVSFQKLLQKNGIYV